MVWIVVVVTVLVLALLMYTLRMRSRSNGGDFPYRRRSALFSPAERSFLGALDLATGRDFRIFGKVRVGDLLAPQDRLDASARTTALNKINRKHFDFVLCRPHDLSVLCVIELNDKSHQNRDRQLRDYFLIDACKGARLPLLMFDARRVYSPSEIGAKIAKAVSENTPSNSKPPVQAAEVDDEQSSLEPDAPPRCPRCASIMVMRTAKGGDNAGKDFWGCPNFPRCREILTV